MIKNFFQIAFRNIVRSKGVSFINISGLAIGLAASLLILMWIQFELSYDKFFTDADQIYRVEEDQHYGGDVYHVNVTPYPSGIVWKTRLPEIIDYTRFSYLPRLLFEREDLQLLETGVRSVDSTFFRIFDFKFKYGNPYDCLSDPHSIVLTEEMAEKYFGDKNPLGESITIEKTMDFMVSGVLEELPENTIVGFDALIPFRFLDEIGITNDHWGSNSISTYVKCVPEFDRDELGIKMTEIQREFVPESLTDFMLAEFTRVHLHSYFGYDRSPGAIVNVYIFGAIGLFVLIIACINFINLTTARSSLRGKEIGIKKVIGARRKSMIIQFMLESIFQVFLALLISIVLMGLLLGPFNTIAGRDFVFADLFKPAILIAYLLVTLIAGIIAGIYPAFYLSSFKAIDVMKGQITRGKKSVGLRRVLVIIQFVLSVFLAVSGIVIYSQLNYMRDMDMGYKKENLAIISLTSEFESRYNTIKDELRRNPNIEYVSACWLNPISIGSNSSGIDWEGKDPEQRVLFSYNGLDYDLIEAMGYKLKEGRTFSREFPGDIVTDTVGNFIVNEEVVRIMGIDDPVGKYFRFMGVSGRIIGVLEDFHFKSARAEIEPIAMILGVPERYNNMLIRFSENNPQAGADALREIWAKTIPDYPLTFRYAEDMLEEAYRGEFRMGQLFKFFTILATLIAAMGLYGLSAFIAERRTREIGIRKTMGSSVGQIVGLLSREFLIIVLIALIIGFSMSWWYLGKWLEDFPYHVGLNPLIFILVGVGALLISIATVSFQSYRAAITNPAETLRIE